MSSENKNLSVTIIVAAVLVAGALVFAGLWLGGTHMKTMFKEAMNEYIEEQQAKAQGAQQPETPKFIEEDMSGDGAVEGNEDAKVTIVEFSDFQCPYCGKFYTNAYQQIKKEYIDTGKVKLVFRHLPLGFHPGAMPAAVATECAREQGGDKAFFKMHDEIFGNQSTIFGASDVSAELKKAASKLGLNATKFNDCFDNQDPKDDIEADSQAAASVNINGTPAFIINGQVVSGAMPFDSFKTVLDAELAK